MTTFSLSQLLLEEVLNHQTLLETIAAKSAGMGENYATQLELQELEEQYGAVRDRASVGNITCTHSETPDRDPVPKPHAAVCFLRGRSAGRRSC